MLYQLLRSTVLTLTLAVSLAPAQQPAPSDERLRTHVTRLSSAEFDGRRTGTTGADAAAEYIASEFRRYGLQAPANSKNYQQQFPFIANLQLGRNNSMLFKTRADNSATLDLRLGEDWSPLGFSSSSRVAELPLVFVGYGIAASTLNYDDYAGVEVANRIALAFAGSPDGDNAHGTFARYAELRWKAAAARDRGAQALVVIAREANFKEDRLTQLRNDYTAGDAGLPVVVISRAAARRILEFGGVARPLDEIEQTLAHGAQAATASSSPAAAPKNLSVPLNNAVTLTVQTEIVRVSRAAANVVGILPGADEKLKSETVVIGAHYDHLGRGGSGSLAARPGAVHHGADDNASGTAALLELARMFSAAPARRTIVFAAFSGEEEGLLGSNYYVNHSPLPLAQTVAMINLDMIGRLKENQLSIGGVGTAAQWREWINAANTAARFSLSLGEDGFGPSDHSSFYAKQIPVLFFWTGTHEDYHKPSDTSEKINYEGQRRITALIQNLVNSIDRVAQRPTYTTARSTNQSRSTGFRVYLGTVPSYADSSDGVKIDGVRDASPAARAGLRPGDRITKLAGRAVRNVYDYTYALAEMRPDQTYQVEIVRANEGTLMLSITPAARK